MDIKELKQIADIMKRAGLTEVEIEEKDVRVRVCRKSDESSAGQGLMAPMTAAPFAPAPPDPGAAGAPSGPEEAAPESNLATVTSPMVGTFYRSPSPESEPFVEVGSPLEEDSVVCIIEAMKVMNEIQAEIRGKVVEVLVENGQSVEFGQPLIRVKQA